jgi:hypothetical protein
MRRNGWRADPPWLGTTLPIKDRHIAGRYAGLYNFDAIA